MARSVKPTVWVEKRRRAGGTIYLVRAERDGRRYPSIACGPSAGLANRIRDALALKLWERDPKLERILAECAAGTIQAATFGADVLRYLTENVIPDRHVPRTTRYTVGELVDEYLKESKRDKSARGYEIDVMALGRLAAHFGRERDLETITSADIRKFHGAMRSLKAKADGTHAPLSRTSEAIYLFAVRAAFNRARRPYRWIEHDPFDGINIYRVDSKGRYIHDDEFEKVRPLAEKRVMNGRSLWAIIEVMRHQGLRTGATLALDGRMIVKATRTLHLTKPRRLGIGREADLKNTQLYAPIHPAVWPIFASAPEAGLIFAGWKDDTVTQALRRICDRLGIARFRPHDLKHTFVTNFLRGGGTLAMASAITGTSEAMLRRVYSHLEGRVPANEMLRVNYRNEAENGQAPQYLPTKTAPPSPAGARRR